MVLIRVPGTAAVNVIVIAIVVVIIIIIIIIIIVVAAVLWVIKCIANYWQLKNIPFVKFEGVWMGMEWMGVEWMRILILY